LGIGDLSDGLLIEFGGLLQLISTDRIARLLELQVQLEGGLLAAHGFVIGDLNRIFHRDLLGLQRYGEKKSQSHANFGS
jgi:hypothetical protein